MPSPGRRSGSDTKAEIREVATELFTDQGYEATSMRQIAERLGITKAALYYHFSSKAEIAHALFARYLTALDETVVWAREQPPGPELRMRAVDRMVGLAARDHLPVLRLALANPRTDFSTERTGARERFGELLAVLTAPGIPVEEELRLRTALLSVHSVLLAARGSDASEDQVIAVARAIARDIARPLTPAPPRPGGERSGEPGGESGGNTSAPGSAEAGPGAA
ncbi:helix-turn-helix domain-containing protein [Streptomyces sp. NPDC093085]|uniref:TetR/AcrR family transcriptional regulator n=1 Tax=Streptomyces sp. NPDC093085 TaxID=3155068 RepID=UPI00343AE75F